MITQKAVDCTDGQLERISRDLGECLDTFAIITIQTFLSPDPDKAVIILHQGEDRVLAETIDLIDEIKVDTMGCVPCEKGRAQEERQKPAESVVEQPTRDQMDATGHEKKNLWGLPPEVKPGFVSSRFIREQKIPIVQGILRGPL